MLPFRKKWQMNSDVQQARPGNESDGDIDHECLSNEVVRNGLV